MRASLPALRVKNPPLAERCAELKIAVQDEKYQVVTRHDWAEEIRQHWIATCKATNIGN